MHTHKPPKNLTSRPSPQFLGAQYFTVLHLQYLFLQEETVVWTPTEVQDGQMGIYKSYKFSSRLAPHIVNPILVS